LQVEQAWLSQRSSAEQIMALRTALASAQLQERAAVTGREVGVRTQSDVLAAQAQTFEAKRQLAAAFYDYEYSRVALAAASGTLTTESLAGIDRDLTAY
jgi:outer membrane protein